jgi:hypothetical protein
MLKLAWTCLFSPAVFLLLIIFAKSKFMLNIIQSTNFKRLPVTPLSPPIYFKNTPISGMQWNMQVHKFLNVIVLSREQKRGKIETSMVGHQTSFNEYLKDDNNAANFQHQMSIKWVCGVWEHTNRQSDYMYGAIVFEKLRVTKRKSGSKVLLCARHITWMAQRRIS